MLLRDLDFFILIAESGSFRGAAARAGVTQPAVTKGIKRLEAELGLTLLERSGTGTTLSEAGKVFLSRARQLRNDLGDALREANDLRSRALGLLRVGVAPTLVQPFFSRAGEVFLRQRPAARFSLQIGLSDVLFAGLRRGDLDIVLSSIPSSDTAGLSIRTIGFSRLVVVAGQDHPALAKRHPRLEDLVPYPWILPRRGVLARDWVDGVFARRGLPLPVPWIEVDTQTDALLPMIRGTELVSISSVRDGEPMPAGLAAAPLDELSWERTIGAITRADQPPSPLAQHFVELLAADPPAAG